MEKTEKNKNLQKTYTLQKNMATPATPSENGYTLEN